MTYAVSPQGPGKRNPIYLFYAVVTMNAEGLPGKKPGDKHYQCYHGNRKVLTITRAMRSSLNGTFSISILSAYPYLKLEPITYKIQSLALDLHPQCLQLHLAAPPKKLISPHGTRNESGHTSTSWKSFSSCHKRALTLAIPSSGGRAIVRNSQTYHALLVISSRYQVSIPSNKIHLLSRICLVLFCYCQAPQLLSSAFFREGVIQFIIQLLSRQLAELYRLVKHWKLDAKLY